MKKNMTVGKRLAIGFGLVLFILLVMGLITLGLSVRIQREMTKVINEFIPLKENALQIRAQYPRVDAGENALLSVNITEEIRKDQYDRRFKQAEEIFKNSIEAIEKLPKTSAQESLWKEFKSLHEKWWKEHEKFVQIAKEFEKFGIQDPGLLQRDIEKFRADHYALCDKVLKAIFLNQSFEGGDDHTACAFGKWLATVKFNNDELNKLLEEIKPHHQKLHECVKNVKAMLGTGNKDEAIQTYNLVQNESVIILKHLDEILKIVDNAKNSYNVMSDFALIDISKSYSEARDALQKFVDQVSADADSANKSITLLSRYTQLTISVLVIISIVATILISWIITRGINKTLRRVSTQIKEGAYQVRSASEQVSQASQTLSQSASESASSIEETSASLEELTSMTQQNAANAAQADQMMLDVQSHTNNSVEAMNKLLDNMVKLQEASAKTSGIIKTIDEIAFQTNLLALNAAVEAARAGEAGKGFAVVAEEVRRLAQRSAEAAKNTQELIEEAIKRSDESARTSKEVGELLEKNKRINRKILDTY